MHQRLLYYDYENIEINTEIMTAVTMISISFIRLFIIYSTTQIRGQ